MGISRNGYQSTGWYVAYITVRICRVPEERGCLKYRLYNSNPELNCDGTIKMINTFLPSYIFRIHDCRCRFSGRAVSGRLAALFQIPLLLTPWIASAADDSGAVGRESPLIFLILFATSVIAISIILIVGITRWGQKQDQIQSMMPFCIRHLVKSKNESDKIAAAKVLGGAKHPAALLILTDIVNDEKAEEGLHDAAVEALQEMSQKYRKYTDLIDACLYAVVEKDHQKTVDLLIRYFESGGKQHVQSAYVIGREYIRMENYPEARIWLQKAKDRNRKAHVYINQISQLITTCSQHLYDEGDALFKTGEYHDALERYALASHDMEMVEKQRHSTHLRLTCIYCKLEQYENAHQETLLALQDQHETETSMALNKLLQKIRNTSSGSAETKAQRAEISAEIDALVNKTMAELI